MELPEEADAGAAVAIDRDDRFEAYLEIAPNPDHTRIDRAGRDKAVAKIIRNGGCNAGSAMNTMKKTTPAIVIVAAKCTART